MPEEIAVEGDTKVRRNKVFAEAPVAYGVALHQPADKTSDPYAGRQDHRINLPRSSREASTRSGSIVKAWMIRATDL